jgi:hypothetical protein
MTLNRPAEHIPGLECRATSASDFIGTSFAVAAGSEGALGFVPELNVVGKEWVLSMLRPSSLLMAQ